MGAPQLCKSPFGPGVCVGSSSGVLRAMSLTFPRHESYMPHPHHLITPTRSTRPPIVPTCPPTHPPHTAPVPHPPSLPVHAIAPGSRQLIPVRSPLPVPYPYLHSAASPSHCPRPRPYHPVPPCPRHISHTPSLRHHTHPQSPPPRPQSRLPSTPNPHRPPTPTDPDPTHSPAPNPLHGPHLFFFFHPRPKNIHALSSACFPGFLT